MSMTDYRSCNKQPAGSPAMEFSRAVNTMTKFQEELAEFCKSTSKAAEIFSSFSRACREEVRNDL